jgi:hypothetical protein
MSASAALTVLADKLGAELIEPAANGQSYTHIQQPGPETAQCIAPGRRHLARHGCATCWEHAAYEPVLAAGPSQEGNS